MKRTKRPNTRRRKQVRKKLGLRFLTLVRYMVLAGCGLVSAFLLMSGYEAVYNRDLPFVHTLDVVNMQAFAGRYDLSAAAEPQSDQYGNFGKPQILKLPKRVMRLDIVPPIADGKQGWLARANTMHLMIAKPPRGGNIGLALLYCRSSFRTIPTVDLPVPGENLFIDTDTSWRYVYKVTSAKIEPVDQQYIVSDDGKTGKLVIACYDSSQRATAVIEATLLSVQGVTQ